MINFIFPCSAECSGKCSEKDEQACRKSKACNWSKWIRNGKVVGGECSEKGVKEGKAGKILRENNKGKEGKGR